MTTSSRLIDQTMAETLGIPPNELESATYGETASWDSVAHLLLMNAIEERFELSLAGADVSEMTDYRSIRDILSTRYGVRFED